MVASYLLPTQYCPVCSKELDAATQVNPGADGPPDVGDVTVCVQCRSFLRFYPGLDRGRPALMLHLMSQEEISELPAEQRFLMVKFREFLKQEEHDGKH